MSNNSTIVDDYLAHYGVQGMKWGVRRATGSVTRAGARAAMAPMLRRAIIKDIRGQSSYAKQKHGRKSEAAAKIVAKNKDKISELKGTGQAGLAARKSQAAARLKNTQKRELSELSKMTGKKKEAAKADLDKMHARDAVKLKKKQDRMKARRMSYDQRRVIGGLAAATATVAARKAYRKTEYAKERNRNKHGIYTTTARRTPLRIAQHDGFETLDDYLQHFGVMGMKWGVRKGSSTSRSEKKASKKVEKADKKFLKSVSKNRSKLALDIYNDAADKSSAAYSKLNSNPKYKKPFNWDNPGKYERDYMAAANKTFIKLLDESAKAKTKGNEKSASGRYELSIDTSGGFIPSITVKDNKLKHSDESAPFKLKFDKSGKIVGITMVSEMEHTSDEIIDDYLKHFGVMGMKWGVRRGSSKKQSRSERKAAKASKRQIMNMEVEMDLVVSQKTKGKNPISYEKAFGDTTGKVREKYVNNELKILNKALSKEKLPEGIQSMKYDKNEVDLDDLSFHVTMVPKEVKHSDEIIDDYLQHFGVMGMKWGVRRGKSTGGKRFESKKSKKAKELAKLSDADLRQKINRLQMEKQYKQLTTKDRGAATKWVDGVVRNAATQLATDFTKDAMKSGGKMAVDRVKKKPKQMKLKF